MVKRRLCCVWGVQNDRVWCACVLHVRLLARIVRLRAWLSIEHGELVDSSFPGRKHVASFSCRMARRLGPSVAAKRRTYDRCFERCAPAVPQHDRPRASTIPLPAHSPCTAASEQSTAAIDPCGDVGCLAGFRQEGSPPYMPCMRYSIKGDTKNWNSLTRYMIRADLDCVFGKS